MSSDKPLQAEPPRDCPLCPRLVAYRRALQAEEPTWYNGPAPSFGDPNARLLVLGLAPGRAGANRTGRPFTGDYAGEVLYPALIKHGFARGQFLARADDGLELIDCMISNAVRCVPPENKPTVDEITTCRRFLKGRLEALPKLTTVLALGRIAHESVLTALGAKRSAATFAHGAEATITTSGRPIRLVSSYHCSRYNVNTNRLTTEMFDAVMAQVRAGL
jgi:uracil-DNA glycosylase family 4